VKKYAETPDMMWARVQAINIPLKPYNFEPKNAMGISSRII